MWHNLLNSLYQKENLSYKDLEDVKNLVAGYYKIPKKVLDNVKVRFSSLPTAYVCWISKMSNYIKILYQPVAKILGLYYPETKEIYVEKNQSKNNKIKTLIHEYIHAAQDYLGKIYKKSREELEKEAHLISDYLFKIYNQNSQKPFSSSSYLALI